MSIFKFSAAIAAIMFSATAANANVITVSPADVGTSYMVNYDGYTGGQVINGLTGQTTFTLLGVNDNSYTFSYTVKNTSTNPITASRISGFGFNTNPDIDSASSTGMFNFSASGNVPSGFGSVDVCFKGTQSGSNCAGGGGKGVTIGGSTSGEFTLNFADALTQLTLSDFFVRYQSIDGPGMKDGSAIGRGTTTGSTSTGGTSTGGTTTTSSTSSGGTPVPAPAGMGLFALGVLGLMARRWQKRA